MSLDIRVCFGIWVLHFLLIFVPFLCVGSVHVRCIEFSTGRPSASRLRLGGYALPKGKESGIREKCAFGVARVGCSRRLHVFYPTRCRGEPVTGPGVAGRGGSAEGGKADEVIKLLSSMNLLEVSHLVKKIESVFGVDVSSAPSPAAPTATGQQTPEEDDAAPVAPKKDEYTVTIESVQSLKRISLIKGLKGLVEGIGLKEAKQMVDTLPKEMKSAIPKAEAEELQKKLQGMGATVSVKETATLAS